MAISHLRAALSRIVGSQSRLPTSSHAHPLVFPHRILGSSAAAAFCSRSFAVEDYLVSRCGLTKAQALKAAAKLSHLRSGAKPEAVLAYLESTLGVPPAGVSRTVVTDPTLLCCNVEKTLVPRVAELHELGLSRDEIARLVPLAPISLHSRLLRSNVEFWLGELGSFDKLLRVLRWCSSLLATDLDKVTRPNVALLRECGMDISKIAATDMYSSLLFVINPSNLKDSVQRVEEMGIDRAAGVFRYALAIFAFTDKEVIAMRIQLLHTLGFSKDDVLAMVRKQPFVLGLSEKKVRGNLNFLMKDAGLEASYIVQRPVLLLYSVERRLLPRHCLLKVLKEKGLLKGELSYYFTASMAEKDFVRKFVLPFKNHVPGIIDDYTSKCLKKATDGIGILWEKTLVPRVAELHEVGLSWDEIARLAPNAPCSSFLLSNLEFWVGELGSVDKLLPLFRRCSSLLVTDLDKVTRPNLVFLRQCGLSVSEIAAIDMYSPSIFTMKLENPKEAVQRVEELGIQRGVGMFRYALSLVAITKKEVVARRIRLLHDLGFSKDDALAIARKQPLVLSLSEKKIRGNLKFLMKDVGMEVLYIVTRPVLLIYSVEWRLMPRRCLLKVLKEKGLLKGELDYYTTASMAEKAFVEKFVHPFKTMPRASPMTMPPDAWGR
ncbi:hypothetical protein HU200_006911 [Digitaria exilis]|uniref:Uncharacterized protein n=1 Tax=Digitaria exilis TaxID=1010633 RepID=A0A835FNM9_9POAL|nr:hypothetical protein HU200_006911 [Digitaria exilis]